MSINLMRELFRRAGRFLPALLASFVLMLTGCGGTSETPSANSPATANAATAGGEGAIENTATGLCANRYYPVDPNTDREYKITGAESTGYVLEQEASGNDAFSEQRKFDSGMTVKNNWICTPEGLRTAEYTNAITMQEGDFEMETKQSSGITVPSDLSQGKEWTATYDVVVKMNAGPVKTNADGDITITNKVANMNDKITAGGKEFEAIKVDSVIDVKITMGGRTMPGARVPVTNWFVPGIGLVKQESNAMGSREVVEYVGVKQ